jgi:hypothetical protein
MLNNVPVVVTGIHMGNVGFIRPIHAEVRVAMFGQARFVVSLKSEIALLRSFIVTGHWKTIGSRERISKVYSTLSNSVATSACCGIG